MAILMVPFDHFNLKIAKKDRSNKKGGVKFDKDHLGRGSRRLGAFQCYRDPPPLDSQPVHKYTNQMKAAILRIGNLVLFYE